MSIDARPTPVAIIGIGCLFPKADNVESFWANLQDGVDAITDVPPTHWRPDDYFDNDPKKPDHTYARRGGFLSPVDFPALEMGISPNVLEATDTSQLLGLMAAKQALEVAGYGNGRDFDRSKVSVILGVTGTLELVIPLGARLGHPRWKRALKDAGVDDATAKDVIERISESYVGWQEDSFPGLLGNVVAGRIANRLDLGGTNCVVDAACASSLSALHLGLLELSAGRSDMVIAGGMDTFNDIFMYMCFSKTPALSPSGDARPFDQSADGTILGEGLGCVLLKRLDDAERDGDKIFAVIKSVGTSSDGKGQAIYAPSPKGQTKALRQAYRLAGVTPETIELLEAHGTGTKAGDAAEVTALTEVYRNGVDAPAAQAPKQPWCALGSVKSQIGHTKAAAGAAGLIKAALALYHKVLPPTIKVAEPIEQVGPERSPFYVNTQKRPWLPARAGHPRRAAVSAFGFGGSNFHCVLEEYQPTKTAIDWDASVQILAFSAPTPEELRQRLTAWPTKLTWDDVRIEAARSRARFFGKHRYRLTIIAERDKKPVDELIATALALLDKSPDKDAWSTPEGICFGRGHAPGKLAFLFPGQGSQYVGMMRDLACRWPAVQAVLAEANAAFAKDRPKGDERRLSDFIYPHPAFRDEDRQRDEAALRATDIAQPALGALSLASLRVLEHFHVHADAVAGHSFGELTALCAAGRIDSVALHMLAHLRGRLMAAGAGDRGGMIAVRAPLATVESILREDALDLVLANRNAPSQAVLSGSSLEIARAQEAFARRQIEVRVLPVAAAFHSPFVAEAKRPFQEALERVDVRSGDIAVYANSTAEEYPREAQKVRSVLAHQLAEPVKFVEEIEAMHRAGVRTFVEVGPGRTLTGLVAAILEGKPHEAMALDASQGKRSSSADLARVLAQLATLGYRADLARWDEGQAERKTRAEQKPTLTVPICGANYVKPKTPRPAVERSPAALAPVPPAPPVTTLAATRQSPSLKVPAPPPVPIRKAMSEPQPRAVPHDAGALALTQENLIALQKLAEQTAQLHRQFLEGQDRTLQVFQSLLERQHHLLGNGTPPLRAIATPPVVKAQPASPAPLPIERKSERDPIEPPTVAIAPSATNGKVETTLLEVVAAKTGYPPDMLQLDMELDTDLGIDSIKRVEIFSLLQEKLPDAPPVKAEHLGTLRTLRHVIEFLGGAPRNGAAEHAEPPAHAGPNADRARDVFLEVVAQKTGYPPDMLQLDMELDTDLGIDSIKRVEIFSLLQEKLPDAPTVKAEHLGTLRTMQQVIDFLAGAPSRNGAPRPEPKPPVPTEIRAAELPSTATIELQRLVPRIVEMDEASPREPMRLPADAEIWIAGDDALAERIAARLELLGARPRLIPLAVGLTLNVPERLAGLVIAPNGSVDASYLLDAFKLLKHAAAGLKRSGETGGAVFATLTRLGGAFGLSGLPAQLDPVAGGLAGLAKTARHEWPSVNCKAIDLATDWDDLDEAAFAIVEELGALGPEEVGLTPRGRFAVQLEATPLDAVTQTPPISRGDVVIVSGGARGVTAEAAVALARSFGATLVLLGRSPAPTAEPDWLVPLSEESDIKRSLLTQMNGQATPKEVSKRCQALLANREIQRTLTRIEAAGGRAVYRQVDVRDRTAVTQMIDEVRREFGPIKGLIHGAGVLADRLIVDKTPEQFETVCATKVASLENLLAALAPDHLRLLALYSSSSARFGRAGQIDYAVANEVLNKLAQREALKRPKCKVVSFNWGPWDGGMVNDSLKKVFADEGIGVIPLQTGGDFFVREIMQAGSQPAEVVVLGPAPLGEVKASQAAAAMSIAFEREISVAALPVLASHVIKGHAVLPVALAVEWLAHGALHANPGLAFHGFNDLRVLKGIVLHDASPLLVRVATGKAHKDGALHRVPVEISSQPVGGRAIVHVRADIVLTAKLPAADDAVLEIDAVPYARDPAEIYRDVLFHGPALQGIERVEACSDAGILATAKAAPPPGEWVRRPLRGAWLADPLAFDCALQLLIVWCREQHGAGCLPTAARAYRQYRRGFPGDGVRIVCRVTHKSEHRLLADVDFLDRAGALIARLSDCECVIDASLNEAFRMSQLGAAR